MTTITLDAPIHLKNTHFYDADTLIKALLQSEFENNLEQKYRIAKTSPETDFVNL